MTTLQEKLIDIGRRFYARGWSVGTSSNYSLVAGRSPLELLVTASGMDKGQLVPEDFVRVNADGLPVVSSNFVQGRQSRSSAETMLHVVLAHDPQIGCVLHTHSVWGTMLSDWFFPVEHLEITGYEMLKGLAGVTSHEASVRLKIFENTQDIAALAREVAELRQDGDPTLEYGFLLRRHGLYTWGHDVEEARRHVEILEFLFEVIGRTLSLKHGTELANASGSLSTLQPLTS